MKGHIRQRSPGVWCIVVDAGRTPAGKRLQRWTTVHGGKREAQAELNRLLAEAHATGGLTAGRMTVATFLDKWMEHATPNLAPQSVERYELACTKLKARLGSVRLDHLSTMRVQNAYGAALADGTSPHGVRYLHTVLRRALGQAVKWRVLSTNAAAFAEPPRVTRQERPSLTPEQAIRLLAAAREDADGLPVILALGLGLRSGEVRGLQWQDVDFNAGVVRVQRAIEACSGQARLPKSGHGRAVTLPGFVVLVLRAEQARQQVTRQQVGEAWNGAGWVWPNERGDAPGSREMYRIMTRVCTQAGIPRVRFHDLRHTHASILLSCGEQVRAVSERLGHASVNITLAVYGHVLPGTHEEIARRLDDLLR